MNYAEIRELKLAENRKTLEAIGIETPVLKEPEPKAPKKPAGTKRKAKEPPLGEPLPTRRSSRSAVIHQSAEEKAKAAQEEKECEEFEAAEKRRRKHDPRQLEVLSSVTGAADQASLMATFAELNLRSAKNEKEWFVGQPAPKWPDRKGVEKLKTELGDVMEHRGTIKITPERVYSMCFHADTKKDIIFVGDKDGNIGVWDATEAVMEDEDEGEEENRGVHWYWKAHQRTVSVLKFSPTDLHTLYSSSYDCTLRATDLATGVSTEVIDADRWDGFGDNLIHGFDFEPNGHVIWACDNSGGIIRRDLREPIETAQRWTVDRAKVGCISINPKNPNIAVTAHLKHDVRVWDLKKLCGLPGDDDDEQQATNEQIEECIIASHQHLKAASASYFDRSGTKILTTSYDDLLRVFEIDPFKVGKAKALSDAGEWDPISVIPHNNQTGAYVSVFRAQWSTCPTLPLHIHVANMGRTLDIVTPLMPSRGQHLVGLEHDVITAVPAVTCSHPTRELRYAGGNSSGKISFYSEPRE